ncbi:ABC transporter substrate-binding protein [Duganella phyllosphaerae]|uniref:Glutathione-binding protein GsiB n=1 Tax=Duganella phyllosphaerae TaxID=762836 RepID=A0A1E7X4T4_9BURK|nr:ABC transporter substrate-binding protein [Duganella phyllosphaerae]OFA07631.1 glutathione-binding protein GsiB precursor [Duganella phyllosphaerae]
MRPADDRFFTRRLIAAALLALPLAALADPGHVHELTPASADTLTVVGPWELTGIEPSRSGFMFTRMEVTQTLLDVDDAGHLRAGAASSWEVSSDQREWRFFIRQGNRFHDGSPLTANTALVSLRRALKTPGVLQLAGITDLYAERGAVVVRLRKPFAPLPFLFTQYSTQLLAPSSFNATGRVTAIVGSGPYRIKSITLPQMFETEFADTWNGDAPAVRRARYISVSRAETRALMAQSRQADLAFTLDPPSIRRLQRQQGVSLVAQNLPRTTFLKLNAAHPFLRDERVRQAISLGVERDGIARALLRDADLGATQLFPPALAQWHQTTMAPLRTDPAAARALLQQAGFAPGADGILWRDGRRFAITLYTFVDRPELPLIASAIQEEMRQIGIAVRVVVGNSSDIPAGHRSGSLEMGLVARNFGTTPDPTATMVGDYTNGGGDWGAMNWHDAALDAALARLSTGEAPGAQNADRAAVAARLQASLPVIPVVWYRQTIAVSSRVRNVSIDAFERSYRISDIKWHP